MRLRGANFFLFNIILKVFEIILNLSGKKSNFISAKDDQAQEIDFDKWFNNFQKRYYPKLVFGCFYLIGFCNLFPIITMISAAHDLLKPEANSQKNNQKRYGGKYDCNEISTGTIFKLFYNFCFKSLSTIFRNKANPYLKNFLILL